jgi:CubicO group peptidase (beta-lactamase class C family)
MVITAALAVAIIVIVVLLASNSTLLSAVPGDGAAGSKTCNEWPTQTWCTSTPEEQDMDPAQLDQMIEYIDEHKMAIDSILIVRHGQIVFEEYRNDYHETRKHHVQSVTKSFSSVLIGIAIQQGLIESVDQRMVDLFPEHAIANLDARKQRITLEHLLTMSDGMDWHELDYPYDHPENTLGQMWVSRDAVQHVLDRPMAREPGEAWAYNSGTSILLGGIIEQASGRDVLGFAREHLFDPIGIGDVVWTFTTGGHYHTDGGLYLTPRDMARFGYLMLQGGTWDGREIVPAEWVARSSTAYYQTPWGYGYGYQWWVLPDGSGYGATGHYEQRIFVLPEADAVVVFTADIPDDDPNRADRLLYRFILPAFTDLNTGSSGRAYANYGFTFVPPLGFSVHEAPIPGQDSISESSGLVQFNSLTTPLELITIVWTTAQTDVAKEVYLQEFLDSASQQPEVQIEPGEVSSAWKDDEEVTVQFFDLVTEGYTLPGIVGTWSCEEANRGFILSYVVNSEQAPRDLVATLERHLDALACQETP